MKATKGVFLAKKKEVRNKAITLMTTSNMFNSALSAMHRSAHVQDEKFFKVQKFLKSWLICKFEDLPRQKIDKCLQFEAFNKISYELGWHFENFSKSQGDVIFTKLFQN